MRLEVTRKSDLAVRTLRVLAESTGRMKGPEIAEIVGSTSGFVSQVVAPLVREGWVRSDPGPSGGYMLQTTLDAVSVRAVIEAVEGPTDTGRCVLVDGPCNDGGVCTMHEPWGRARAKLLAELDAISVADAVVAPNRDDQS